jgi:hypothetical protein
VPKKGVKVPVYVAEFTGSGSVSEWDNWLLSIEMLARGGQASDTDIRQLLLQSLRGTAMEALRLNKHWMSMDYGKILQEMANVFDPRLREIPDPGKCIQGANEDVASFNTRFGNEVDRTRPRKTPGCVVLELDAETELRASNPAEDALAFRDRCYNEQIDRTAIPIYLKNIRLEIKMRMPTGPYTKLADAFNAAVEAEKYLIASGVVQYLTTGVHHLSLGPEGAGASGAQAQENSTGSSINHLAQNNPLMAMASQRTVGSTGSNSQGPLCYNCREHGHVRRNCPQPKKNKRAGRSPTRGGAQDRGRTPSTERRSREAAAEQWYRARRQYSQERARGNESGTGRENRSKQVNALETEMEPKNFY